jgi:uncharacterized protein (TIGR02145 family)
VRSRILIVALSVAFGFVGVLGSTFASGSGQDASGSSPSTTPAAKRMPDGKEWMSENLNVAAEASHCYNDSAENCRRYGRLYTWESAQRACRSLGNGWRLPTNEEWRELARHYGGLREETADLGKASWTALIAGGASGFNAVYGGGLTDKSGEYQRLEAHGFYWTASETGPDQAWLYNFGKNGQSVNRHKDGGKWWALSVRCVRE